MKVCTDACILGAWFAATTGKVNRILDIGSGTGLLMMMLAQKVEAEIHGVEIDQACFQQLKKNISQNFWSSRLQAVHGDIRTYSPAAPYDFIITNPPFFENDLQSQDEREQLAKHSQQLSLGELLQSIDKHLHVDGTFGILLPHSRWTHFNDLAIASGFFLCKKLFIRHSPMHPHFRSLLQYSRKQVESIKEMDIIINKVEGGYTDQFVALMKDYYLYL